MTTDEIIAAAKELYDNAGSVNSLSSAQEAIRTVGKLIYYLAKAQQDGKV